MTSCIGLYCQQIHENVRDIIKLLENHDKVPADLLFIQTFSKQTLFVKKQLLCNLVKEFPKAYSRIIVKAFYSKLLEIGMTIQKRRRH